MQSRSWNGVLAALGLACVLGNPLAMAAADPPAKDAKAAEKPKGTIKSAMADVGDISSEVRAIEKRLAAIEQSVSEINASLKHMEPIDKSVASVGELARPEGLNALVKLVSEAAYDRGVALVFVATACAAALLVLLAFLFRWSRRPLPIDTK